MSRARSTIFAPLRKLFAAYCVLAFASNQCVATTYDISSTADSGAGTLRQEVTDSNTAGGTNIISWTTGSGGTITLGSDLPAINANTTLDVSGAPSAVTIGGGVNIPLNGSVSLANGSASQTWTISDVIKDGTSAGSINYTGPGTLALTGANTYSGGTTVNSGTLAVGNNSALGSGALNLGNSTTLSNNNDILTVGNNIVLSAGSETIYTINNNWSLTGMISGSGSLDLNGGSTLTLSGANTYSGGTAVQGGSVIASNNSAFGTGTVSIGYATSIQSNISVSLANNFNFAAGSAGTETFITNSSNMTLSGIISGNGDIIKEGAGGLFLTGANTFSGNLSVSNGTLNINNNSALGTATLSITDVGTLQSGAPDLTVSNNIVLGPGSETIDNNGHNLTLSGAISGSGGTLFLYSTGGGGTVTLSGANTYTGGTTINPGVAVVAGAANVFSTGAVTLPGGNASLNLAGFNQNLGSLNIGSGTTVDLAGATLNVGSDNGSMTFGGLIEDSVGTGSLIKSGSGTLTLSGTNTLTGGIDVTAGSIAISNALALGPGTLTLGDGTQIVNTSTNLTNNVVLSAGSESVSLNGNDLMISGTIGGPGQLNVTGGNTLYLLGANTYSGGTAVLEGSVVVENGSALGTGPVSIGYGTSIQAGATETIANNFNFIAGSAEEETFNPNAFDMTLSGIIAGSGNLIKTGTGTLILSGANTYTGGTNINAGTIQLGAENALPVGGTLNVAAGGTFDMNGHSQTVGILINSGGILAGAQTLTAASYVGSGVINVFLTPSVTNLRVSGTANLSGGTLSILSSAGPGFYDVVSAGSLTGQFAAILPPPGMEGLLLYSPTDLVLAVSGPLSVSGQTPNQSAMSSYLNSLTAIGSPQMQLFLIALGTLPTSAINVAIDQMSPVSYAALSGMSFSNSMLQSSALNQRMASLRLSAPDAPAVHYYEVKGPSYPGTLVADPIGDVSAVKLKPTDRTTSLWSFFASAIGTQGSQDSISGTSGYQPGYSFSSAGGIVGGDYRVNENLAVGVAGGYIDGSANVDSNGGSMSTESMRLGVYGTVFSDAFHANAYLGGAYDTFSASRNINFSGLSATATSSPSGNEVNFDSEAGYDIKTALAVLSPFAGLAYDRLSVGSFTESGAGLFDLAVSPQTAQSMRSRIGAQISRDFHPGGVMMSPYAKIGFQHEFEDQSRAIQAQFAGQGGGTFNINTDDVDRNGYLFGLGLNVDWNRSLSSQIAYAADERSDFHANTFSGTARLKF